MKWTDSERRIRSNSLLVFQQAARGHVLIPNRRKTDPQVLGEAVTTRQYRKMRRRDPKSRDFWIILQTPAARGDCPDRFPACRYTLKGGSSSSL